MNDSKVGYNHLTVQTLTRDGQPLLRYQADCEMRLVRFRQATLQQVSYSCLETKDGQLLEFETTLKSGEQPTITQGVVKNGQLEIVTRSAGAAAGQTNTLPWKSEWLGCFADQVSLQKKPMQPGEKRSFHMLLPIFNQLVEVQLTADKVESTFVLSERQDLLRIETISKFQGGELRMIHWADEQGVVHKTWVPGMNQTSYLSTKAFCLAPSEAVDFDLGLDAVVKVDEKIANPHATNRIVYQARLKYEDPAEVFVSGGTQIVEPIDEHTAQITVRAARYPFPDLGEQTPPTPEDLAPNSVIQSDDPRVLKLAGQVAPEETDPWLTAVALESSVKKLITKKNFKQAFATAAEVAENGEGDCTEHAVLLAALCRARQIPARVAMGLIFLPDAQGFAYHMWTEVWVHEQWVPLDATLGQGGIGAAHIKIAHASLNGSGAYAAFLPVVRVLGQLELEIKEVEQVTPQGR
ncbi:transglutaminase-like domain-containing protein [Lignipirellula cremea]|nr:transglutaminase family protein [Lignipirellula cremea]